MPGQLGERGIQRQFLALARRTALQLHHAGLLAARTDDQLPGQADQVHVGELGAGPFLAVVVETVQPGVAQLDQYVLASGVASRSEEHTSELQSLMRISYAVFCLTTKTKTKKTHQ